MKRTALVLVTALAVSQVHSAPYAGYCYPAGIQAGTTNRIVVGGQRLGAVKGGWVSGGGVEVVAVEKVRGFPVVNGKGQAQWLDKWLYAILAGRPERPPIKVKDEKDLLGWTRHPWWEKMNELPPLELSMVAHYLNTPRNPLQMSPSLSERMIVTVVAAKDAEPGVRDLVFYDDRGATAPRPFFVTALPHAAEPLYRPPKWKGDRSPVRRNLPVVLDGQILPGETDVFRLALRKGPVDIRLTGRELQPYLGDAVPGFFNPVMRLTDAKGREIAFADDFLYLPDPVLRLDIPVAGDYLLEVRDNLYRGRDDFVYSVTCTQDASIPATMQERAFPCCPCPVTVDRNNRGESDIRRGVLKAPGRCAWHDFEVKAPGAWSFELFARRLGSPLDGVLRLYGLPDADDKAPLLATWDDVTNEVFVGSVPQAECDPIGGWTFSRPGRYRLSVADRVGAGGDDYRYELRLGPSEPSFEVYATKSSFVLHRSDRSSARLKLKVVRRGGFAGPVELDSAADFLFSPRVIPAGSNEFEVVCSPVRRNWTGVKSCSFTASAETGRGRRRVSVMPADEAEQAFAYTHLLPAQAFSFTMLDIYGKLPHRPEWIPMPEDVILPPKVLRTHAALEAGCTNFVAAYDALANVEVPIAPLPEDFGDGILLAKFAASAAAVRARREVVSVEPPGGGGELAAARAALAGITRLVTSGLAYADGDARRVRIFSRTAAEPSDNDILLYVPEGDSPLAGSVGKAARRLRDGGWCFDFVTDAQLEKAPLGRKYRAVYVPALQRPMPERSADFLARWATNRNCTVVREKMPEKKLMRQLADKARRENLPTGVRFARFGTTWGEAWYFVCNVGKTPVSAPWRFNIRGQARHAVAMEIETGRMVDLPKQGKNAFAYALAPGKAAWIFVTARDFDGGGGGQPTVGGRQRP